MEQLTSIAQIDAVIAPEFSKRNKNDNYVSELWRLFILYRNLLHRFFIYEGTSLYEDSYIKKSVYNSTLGLKKMAEYYLKGNLLECETYIRRYFKRTGNRISRISYFPIVIIPKGSFFYRLVSYEAKSREGVFHRPFEDRGKIPSYRYSIPGHPCLYLGNTIKDCMVEVKRDQKLMSVSAFKNTSDIKVFDFRFHIDAGNKASIYELYNQLYSYPFKIAASLPVRAEDEANNFKEEYIIPQLILHNVIMQNQVHEAIGIIYSSTKRLGEGSIDDIDLYSDLVIPAKNIKDKGFCFRLSQLFTLTEPICMSEFNEDNYSLTEKELSTKTFDYINLKS